MSERGGKEVRGAEQNAEWTSDGIMSHMAHNYVVFWQAFLWCWHHSQPPKHPIDLHQRVFPGRNASFNGRYKCSCSYSSWHIQTWCFSDIEMGPL